MVRCYVQLNGGRQSLQRSISKITVCLGARGDGTKLKPYILLPRKRPLPELVKRFRDKAVLKFEGTNWMNQALTEDYLQNVIGPPMFTPQRLLVWASFRCHISNDTKANRQSCHGDSMDLYKPPMSVEINHLKITIPKNTMRWLEYLIEWIVKAWDSLSRETMLNLFKVCGLTNDLDCSEDGKIIVFNDGKCCAGKLHEFHNELGRRNTDERNVFLEVNEVPYRGKKPRGKVTKSRLGD